MSQRIASRLACPLCSASFIPAMSKRGGKSIYAEGTYNERSAGCLWKLELSAREAVRLRVVRSSSSLSLPGVFHRRHRRGSARNRGERGREVTKRRVTAAVPIPREGSKLNADDPTTRETSLWGAAAYVSVKGRL